LVANCRLKRIRGFKRSLREWRSQGDNKERTYVRYPNEEKTSDWER